MRRTRKATIPHERESANQSPRLLRQLVVPLVLVSLAVALVEAGLSIYLIYRAVDQQVLDRVELVLAATEHEINQAGSSGEIQRFLSFIGSEPSIEHLSFVDARERKILASTRYSWIDRNLGDPRADIRLSDQIEDRLLHKHSLGGDIVEYQRSFRFLPAGQTGVRLGVVVLRIDTEPAYSLARTGVLWSLAVIVPSSILLLFLLFMIFHRTVLSPLEAIRSNIEQWRHRDPESTGQSTTVDLERIHVSNEITELGLVLASALADIAENEQDLADVITELRSYNRKLQIARAEAEEASRVKGEFLANMSHEIRTPMNGVFGMAQRLAQADLPAKQREQVEVIISSAKALLQVINDILDLSRIEAGKLQIELDDISIHELTLEVVSMLRLSAQDKGVEVHLELAENLPPNVLTDPARLRQILTNLISNAIKFTDEGEVKVRGEMLKDAGGEGDLLALTVTDTGIGINPEDLQSLFEPFEQLDASAGRRFGGSGLGLGICKRLVELLGGEIHVESSLGDGSKFEVVIPIEVRDPPELSDTIDVSDLQTGMRPKVNRTERGKYRLLVVEDDEINQQVIMACLEDLGYPTDLAEGGETALELLGRKHYDLVLMDCHMPGLDGYETTRRLRHLYGEDSRDHIPVIAVTAAALDRDRQRCLESGMNAILKKPYSEEELEQMLERFLPVL